MELIKYLNMKMSKSGKSSSRMGLFLCLFCLSQVERYLSSGKRQKSCGCQSFLEEHRLKIGKGNKGKKRTKEHKKKYSEFKKINGTWNKGKLDVYSEETLNKMKEVKVDKKRKPFSEEHKQNMGKVHKGKTKTEEHRRKIAKSNVGKHEYLIGKYGDKNGNWTGGISFEPYSPEFNKQKKKQILERDNYACQFPGCTKIHNKLHIHHIDYNKKNNNSENLIVLGDSCHSQTVGKNNREYWTEFYQKIMMNKLMESLL